MGENEKIQPPTMANLMHDNRGLIFECLCKADKLYTFITTDSVLKDRTELEAKCVMPI